MEKTGEKRSELSRELPDAVATSARQSGRLATALRPALEDALRLSAMTNPGALARALFPVMGRAIRMAVRDMVRRWILRLNHFLLVYVSWRSVVWRAEALRTGDRYIDVVQRHTHERRVRQVFLIHRQTGLLLDSASRDDTPVLDGDMVSAMLTAIQDFVRDSFNVTPREGLERIQVGSRTVWVEQGSDAVLAGVVDGDASPELQGIFHDALARVHNLSIVISARLIERSRRLTR